MTSLDILVTENKIVERPLPQGAVFDWTCRKLNPKPCVYRTLVPPGRPDASEDGVANGPAGGRSRNIRFSRPVLYPIELRGHSPHQKTETPIEVIASFGVILFHRLRFHVVYVPPHLPLTSLDKTVRVRILSGMGNQLTVSPGDVLVYSGTSLMARLINWFTFGPSHVAVVAAVPKSALPSVWQDKAWIDRLLVFESTTLSARPCVIYGIRFAGVQAHEIDDVFKYAGQVWRLPLYDSLSNGESVRLTELAMKHLGRSYDAVGAFLSAWRLLKRILWWRTVQRNTVYCVEYVGSILLDVLRWRLHDPHWNSGAMTPRQFVKVLLDTGLYGELERVK